MTIKKAKDKKVTTKIAKKAKSVEKPKLVPVIQNKDALLSAQKCAEILNISSFEFFIVKNKFNIDNEALFTVPQFKEMYKKTIEGR